MTDTIELVSYDRSAAHELAAAYKVPVFERGTERTTKVDALEEWVLVSANLIGDLHAERLSAYELLAASVDEWEKLEGWEAFRNGKTDSSVDRAKGILRPDLDDRLRKLRWRVARLSEEIERLDNDYAKVSRAYTMISGT